MGFWVTISSGGLCTPLKAQSDADEATEAIAKMASISPAQISTMPDYKTVAFPRAMFGYDHVTAQSTIATNPPTLFKSNSIIIINHHDSNADNGVAVSYQIPDNQLFLEALPAANGNARLLLHGATNEVYELMSKISLSDNSWRPEQALHRAPNERQIYAVVPVLDRTNTLYFWARDWSQVDENHNGIPDWWEWENFGDLNIDVDKDYDGDGLSVRQEYLARIDPNKIHFYLSSGSLEINHRNPQLHVEVSKGHPASIAVLVDANYADAVWQPMKTNVEFDLGPVEGWHEVRLGLRGRATTSRQTWKWIRFRLDTTPPILRITRPNSRVTAGEYAQIEGESSKSLSAITYDIASAERLRTNQSVIAHADYGDAYAVAVRHTFRCVDVALDPGTNEITIHAEDKAGNPASTRVSLILDPKSATNQPLIKLHWPQNGTVISGDTFGLRGFVDDPNAAINAVSITADNCTNMIRGVVERDGSFWLSNVPLHSGANVVSVIASNASGLTSITNITVAKSDLKLTIDHLTPSDPTANGAVSRPGYTIWANGHKAKADANGRWTISRFPHIRSHSGTTVILQVRAIPDLDHGGNGAFGSLNPISPDGVDVEAAAVIGSGTFITSYFLREHTDYLESNPSQDGTRMLAADEEISWAESRGGKRSFQQRSIRYGVTNLTLIETFWEPSRWPQPLPSGICRTWSSESKRWQTNEAAAPPPFDATRCEHADVDYLTADGQKHVRRIVQTDVGMATGGQAITGHTSLYCLSSALNAIDEDELPKSASKPIPPEEISLGALGKLGSDGKLWVVMPDGLQ